MDFHPDKMRKRFQELTDKYDKAMEKIDPLQQKLSELVGKYAKEEQSLREQIKKAREGLYENEMERAALARALGGKTGSTE